MNGAVEWGIEVGGEVVPCTLTEWIEAMGPMSPEQADESRRIDRTPIGDDIWVSTVFLGLNHGHGGPDLWYETMVFADRHPAIDQDCTRWTTRAEAVEGHGDVVRRITEWLAAQLDTRKAGE